MKLSVCPRALISRILGLALYLWCLGALASPDGQAQIIGADGTVVPGSNAIITDDLGEIRGTNLFHRFLEFNLASGNQATFLGPDMITNIISLVTGDNPSNIDGRINSQIPGANFFLLNPNGVIFGNNASLSVNGSFHVSTADSLRFDDDTVFNRDTVFTDDSAGDPGDPFAKPPVAFGFMGNRPSPIVIDGGNLSVPRGTLSVVGGDLTIMGGGVVVGL